MKHDPFGRMSVEPDRKDDTLGLSDMSDVETEDSLATSDHRTPLLEQASEEVTEDVADQVAPDVDAALGGEDFDLTSDVPPSMPGEAVESSDKSSVKSEQLRANGGGENAKKSERFRVAITSIQNDIVSVRADIAILSDMVIVAIDRLARKMSDVEQLVHSYQGFQNTLSRQIRWLANKVEALPTTLAEPRLVQIFSNLLQVNDLLESLIADSEKKAPHEGQPRYDLALKKLRNVLTSSGVTRIPCDGAFDADFHEAVGVEETSSEDFHDMIKEVVRSGFRTEHELLRPASVVIWRYRTPRPDEEKCEEKGTEEHESEEPWANGQEPDEAGVAGSVEVDTAPRLSACDVEQVNSAEPCENGDELLATKEEDSVAKEEAHRGPGASDSDNGAVVSMENMGDNGDKVISPQQK